MKSEQELLRQIMADVSQGDEVGQRLGYDEVTKTLRPFGACVDPDRTIDVTLSDLEEFTNGKRTT